jgi:hypothetical protein
MLIRGGRIGNGLKTLDIVEMLGEGIGEEWVAPTLPVQAV